MSTTDRGGWTEGVGHPAAGQREAQGSGCYPGGFHKLPCTGFSLHLSGRQEVAHLGSCHPSPPPGAAIVQTSPAPVCAARGTVGKKVNNSSSLPPKSHRECGGL